MQQAILNNIELLYIQGTVIIRADLLDSIPIVSHLCAIEVLVRIDDKIDTVASLDPSQRKIEFKQKTTDMCRQYKLVAKINETETLIDLTDWLCLTNV